jgi:hypothetical protein
MKIGPHGWPGVVFGALIPLLSALVVFPLVAQPSAPAGSAVTIDPERAVPEARKLVAAILSRRPETNITNTGSLVVRGRDDVTYQRKIIFSTIPGDDEWWTVYQAPESDPAQSVTLRIAHRPGQPGRYLLEKGQGGKPRELSRDQLSLPFIASDYSVGDLGLEFFHWEKQRLLKREIRKGQSCDVLESVNEKPAPENYSRVVSWIDADSGGIVHADVYDAAGKLLKQFAPKAIRKVAGQWELKEMEIRNRQTGSNSRIQFDPPAP